MTGRCTWKYNGQNLTTTAAKADRERTVGNMSVPRKYEAISKYTIMGSEYVRLDELNALIREMKQKTREGTEPGYMCEDEGKRISAYLALNHLSVVLNKEKAQVDRMMKTLRDATGLLKLRKQIKQEADEKEEKPEEEDAMLPGRYTLWSGVTNGGPAKDAVCFVKWEDGQPVYSNHPCVAMWFVDEDVAEKTAAKLGDGWEVVDMWPVMTKEQRLLRAIFCGDEDDPEGEPEE